MNGTKLFLEQMEIVDLSIIIVSYNTKELLLKCIESVKKYTKDITYEIIVIDNNSTDGTVEALRKLKVTGYRLQVITNKDNKGFGAANNQGMKKAKGRYILLLNSDTKLIENSLLSMVMWMDEHPKVGIASCKLVNADGTLQPTGGFSPTLPRVFLWATLIDDVPFVGDFFGSYHPHRSFYTKSSSAYSKERPLDWVTGAFFLIRREVVREIGLFDESFFLYVEEVEYCMRTKAKGWEVWYVPKTKIIHFGGASGTREGTVLREFEGLKLLYKKHYSKMAFAFLRLLLFIGSVLRMFIFGIITPRSRIYVHALGRI